MPQNTKIFIWQLRWNMISPVIFAGALTIFCPTLVTGLREKRRSFPIKTLSINYVTAFTLFYVFTLLAAIALFCIVCVSMMYGVPRRFSVAHYRHSCHFYRVTLRQCGLCNGAVSVCMYVWESHSVIHYSTTHNHRHLCSLHSKLHGSFGCSVVVILAQARLIGPLSELRSYVPLDTI